MKNHNSILTDKEMRELLNKYIIEHDSTDLLTQKIIEMESKLVFGTTAAIALSIPNENEMLGKLSKSVATRSGLHVWLVGIGITSVVALGIYKMTGSSAKTESVPPALSDKEN